MSDHNKRGPSPITGGRREPATAEAHDSIKSEHGPNSRAKREEFFSTPAGSVHRFAGCR